MYLAVQVFGIKSVYFEVNVLAVSTDYRVPSVWVEYGLSMAR